MNVVTYSEARSSLKTVLDRVVDDHAPTRIHRRNGDVVIVSEAAYSSMVETLYLLSNQANAAHLAMAVAQDKAGDAQPRPLIEA